MNNSDDIADLVIKLIDGLKARDLKLVTAESCTGGMIASAITCVSGASEVFYGGFVTYANEAKQKMLGVDNAILNQFGAVSEECAMTMAQGALYNSDADVSVAVTGIAGPTGGTDEKPSGLVYIAVGSRKNVNIKEYNFGGMGRDVVREKSTIAALELLMAEIGI